MDKISSGMEHNDDILHKKIADLNTQMDHLAEILTVIVEKMERIEQATGQMQDDLREDLNEFTSDYDIDYPITDDSRDT